MADRISSTAGLPGVSKHSSATEQYLFRLVEIMGDISDRLHASGDTGVRPVGPAEPEVVQVSEPAPAKAPARKRTPPAAPKGS